MSSKVAVITRTKDRPVFLKRAIESVSNQKYKDFVHVIVNDGGDSNEIISLIESFNEDVRMKIMLFHREVSSGAPDTIFNESIDRVNSEYFAIHDDDDTWHPEFLNQTVNYLDEGDEFGAVVVRTEKVFERLTNGGDIKIQKKTHWMPDLKDISLYRQCIDNQLTPIATLFRRSAYEKVGKFDSSFPVIGDWEFGIRLLMQFDVGFIDPGYALAGYHHRKFKKDLMGNSSFGGSDEKHRYYSAKLRNKYLRQEFTEGRLGVGYVMSKTRYEQAYFANLVRKFVPGALLNKLKERAKG